MVSIVFNFQPATALVGVSARGRSNYACPWGRCDSGRCRSASEFFIGSPALWTWLHLPLTHDRRCKCPWQIQLCHVHATVVFPALGRSLGIESQRWSITDIVVQLMYSELQIQNYVLESVPLFLPDVIFPLLWQKSLPRGREQLLAGICITVSVAWNFKYHVYTVLLLRWRPFLWGLWWGGGLHRFVVFHGWLQFFQRRVCLVHQSLMTNF